MQILENDTVRLKKPHPCGSAEWKILRIGADFRMRCEGCGHEVMLSREKLEKKVRRIVRDGVEFHPQAR